MGPRSAHHNASRQRFLAAARDLFAARGYHHTTTRDIVAAADSSMGNLYFYFADKEAVLAALLDGAMDYAERRIDDAIALAPPGPAQLAAAVMVGIETLLGDATVARIVFVEAPQTGLRRVMVVRFSGRVARALAVSGADIPGLTPSDAVAAWVGALWQAVEGRLVAGSTAAADRAFAEGLARWNLRALGIPPAAVDTAIAAVRELDYIDAATNVASQGATHGAAD